jgi:hypothetical protein
MVRSVLKSLLPKATFAMVDASVPLRQLPQSGDILAGAAWGGVVLVGAVWMIQVRCDWFTSHRALTTSSNSGAGSHMCQETVGKLAPFCGWSSGG